MAGWPPPPRRPWRRPPPWPLHREPVWPRRRAVWPRRAQPAARPLPSQSRARAHSWSSPAGLPSGRSHNGSVGLVHKEGGGVFKEPAKNRAGIGRQPHFVQRLPHQHHPPVARPAVHRKWCMPHAEPGMATMFQVVVWPAETHDQEQPQPHLGPGHVLGGIERAENLIVRDLSIERGDEPREAILADDSVNFCVEQIHTFYASIHPMGAKRGGKATAASRQNLPS